MTDPTQTPPPLDLATLRVIAEGATEGPWRIYTVTDSGGRSAAVETAWAHDEQGEDTELVTDWCSPEDAAHIAAFDPPTVLALIARVEAAEAKIAAVRELHPESIAYPLLPDGTPDLNAAPMGRVCLTCSDESIEGNLDDGEWTVEDGGNVFYPCPTIAALDGMT